MFAILGLALGPVLETASAHVVEKIRSHDSDDLVHDGENKKFPHDGCVLGQNQIGQLHYVDINGNMRHDPGEPTICLAAQAIRGGPR